MQLHNSTVLQRVRSDGAEAQWSGNEAGHTGPRWNTVLADPLQLSGQKTIIFIF